MKNPIFKTALIFGALLALAACGASRSLEKQLAKMPQKAMLLSEITEMGITLDTLETIYPSGMPLFGDSIPQGYMQSWMAFVQGLSGAMGEAGMNWTEPYRLWGRAYFAPDGTVEHYFYAWSGDRKPTEEWQTQFREVLERYLATFRFAYPMNRRFAQCGGIRLTPAE